MTGVAGGRVRQRRQMDRFQCAASITPETRHDPTAHRKEIIDQFMGMVPGLIEQLRLEAVPSS
jgi:hypothetical protein